MSESFRDWVGSLWVSLFPTRVRAALLLLLTFSLSLLCRRIKGKETEDEKNEIEEIIETLDNMLAHDDDV